jgi:hypothetical protein
MFGKILGMVVDGWTDELMSADDFPRRRMGTMELNWHVAGSKEWRALQPVKRYPNNEANDL